MPIFHATYDRGVRHFIVQPVRAMDLDPERKALLAIGEDEILPHLNAFLAPHRGTRRDREAVRLLAPAPVRGRARGDGAEPRQERVRPCAAERMQRRPAAGTQEERPSDGRHWVEVRMSETGDRFRFASDGQRADARRGARARATTCRSAAAWARAACAARVSRGQVDQSGQFFLTEAQQRDGYVLLCQARRRATSSSGCAPTTRWIRSEAADGTPSSAGARVVGGRI